MLCIYNIISVEYIQQLSVNMVIFSRCRDEYLYVYKKWYTRSSSCKVL